MDENPNLPAAWKEYLRDLLKGNRTAFMERLESLEDFAVESRELADSFLSKEWYEMHLRCKQDAEDEEEEAAFMRELLAE